MDHAGFCLVSTVCGCESSVLIVEIKSRFILRQMEITRVRQCVSQFRDSEVYTREAENYGLKPWKISAQWSSFRNRSLGGFQKCTVTHMSVWGRLIITLCVGPVDILPSLQIEVE